MTSDPALGPPRVRPTALRRESFVFGDFRSAFGSPMGKGRREGGKAPLRSATLSGLLRAFPGLSRSCPNLEVSSEKDSGTSGDLRALTETFGNFRRARRNRLGSTAWRPSFAFGYFRISSPISVAPPAALPPAEGGADENAKSSFRSDGTNRDLSQSRMSEPLPLSYVTAQEMRCLLHWLSGWTPAQRERFLQDLVDKAVPWKLLPLLEGLAGLNVGPGKPPSIYECQMRLWDQWFRGWSEAERNEFVRQLEEEMPDLAGRFYQEVAATAGQL